MITPQHCPFKVESLEVWRGESCLFSELDFELGDGQAALVTGANGSGKTTFTRFLLRFVEPNSGSIIWGEKQIDEYSLASLRRSIALVSQHVTLFPTSILENIRYGRNDATDEEVIEAADEYGMTMLFTGTRLFRH